MALQGSGAISLANLQTEFGGSHPISLSEYYRGGSYVGSTNTNVPTSGAISLSNFYGASAFLPDYTPDALNWSDIYETHTGQNGGTGLTNIQTVSGINSPVTLRLTISSYGGSASFPSGNGSMSAQIYVVLNGVTQTEYCAWENGTGITTSVDFTVTNGTTVQFQMAASWQDQIEPDPVSGNMVTAANVANITTGANVIDYFSATIAA